MSPKILVIEDEFPLRESLVISLVVEGYEVLGAADGLVGVNLARQITPDVIIYDFHPPQLEGRKICGQLHQNQRTQKIPLILISADRLPEDVVPQPGTFLRKPFGRRDLMDAVLKAIAPALTTRQFHNTNATEIQAQHCPC
ncbi:MAG: response regulator [Synechococcus sp.]|nr:response regulator [Synechococcus sp.]